MTETQIQCQDVEEQLLASLLYDGQGYTLTVAERLTAEMFIIDRHRWMFEAMTALYERGDGIDYASMCEELTTRGKLDAVNGHDLLLTKLVAFRDPSPEYRTHAAMIRRKHERREFLNVGREAGRLAHADNMTEIAAWSKLMRKLEAARPYEPNQNFTFGVDSLQVHGQQLDDMRATDATFKQPFTEVQRAAGNAQPGDLMGVVGPTGSGKSSFLYTSAEFYARSELKRTAYIFTEMRLKKVLDRRLAKNSGIDYRRLKNPVTHTDGETEQQIAAESRMIAWLHRMVYWHAPTPDGDTLIATMQRMHDELGTEVFVIDHMNDVVLPDDGPQSWPLFLGRLEAFSNATGTLIWTAAQRNKNDGKAYMIGQAFDHKLSLVLELEPTRLDYDFAYEYDGKTYENRAGKFSPLVSVNVRKNRDGGPDKFDLLFVGPRYLYVDVPAGFDDGSDDEGAYTDDVYRG